ncbi:WD40 repeat domain-containing protein [Oscillatoria sp. CS-180]|uniref:NACHT and WD repeat domain-containing protein n=1 Tax=Oscillatoria sp. CS-180 TaxID=3021720 RepID=UPI00232E7A00|nr:WD40 repeat domain-containing protein [Oscillatoria sp. CS-180]MDB9527067.1 WD40 repeat domain-containing protein [Oscillatoria sp. CS-180]
MHLFERERQELVRTLSNLPAVQFDEVVFVMELPGGVLPPSSAPQGQRAVSLLEWAEKTGPGLDSLRSVLNEVLGRELPSQEAICPYKGLAYFDCNDEDYKFFYGREELVRRLLDRVAKSNFLAIAGASGSGKSSVLRAGLLQRLKDEKSNEIRILVPGEHPLSSLALAFVNKTAGRVRQAREQRDAEALLQDGAKGLRYLIQNSRAQRVVLVVDQFEEAFTLCHDPIERQQFFETLLGAVESMPSQLCLILAMRSDFLGKCLEQDYGGLAQKVQDHLESVRVMNPHELKLAISEPARRAGLTLEPGLVERLLEDVEQSPGGLPLLQYTLTELWKRREGNQLKISTYRELGGVTGTLKQRADKILESLSLKEQETAKHIFLNLTQLGEGADDTRRRVTQDSLVSSQHPQKQVATVVKALADANLLVTDERGASNQRGKGVATLDVAHEALIRNWPQLKQWLNDSRDWLRQQRKIETDAQEWVLHKKPSSFLLKGPKLAAAESFFKDPAKRAALSSDAEAFVKKSVRSHRNWTLIRKTAFSAAILISAGLLGTFAIANQSSRSRVLAENAGTLLSLREIDALNEALTAANIQERVGFITRLPRQIPGIAPLIDNHFRVNGALHNTVYGIRQKNILRGHESIVLAASVSHDQTLIASADASGVIRLWDFDGALLGMVDTYPLGVHMQDITSVAFDSEDQQLVSASSDGTIALWDLQREGETVELEHETTIAGHSDRVSRVEFEPGDEGIISASHDGTIRFWTLEGEPQTLDGNPKIIQAEQGAIHDLDVRTSDDAESGAFLLASAGEIGTVKLWRPTGEFHKGFKVDSCNDMSCSVYGVGFSHNGDYLATASANGRVHLWTLDGNYIEMLGKYGEEVTELTFAPKVDAEDEAIKDADTLAAVDRDGAIRLWFRGRDGQFTPNEDLSLPGHDLGVNQISFSADGQTVVTASDDQTVQLWQGTRDTLNPVMNPWHGNVIAVSSSLHPSGEKLVMAGDSSDENAGQVRLLQLDLEAGSWQEVVKRPHLLKPKGAATESSSDDIAPACDDDRSLSQSDETEAVPVHDINFSHDGEVIASTGVDGTIKLWTADLDCIAVLAEHESRVAAVSFAPDGTLASADQGSRIVVWEPGGQNPQDLEVEGYVVFYSIAFNPDGTLLAASGHDKIIRLWQKTDAGWQALAPLEGHVSNVYTIAFSPDGKLLISGSRGGAVKIWKINGTTGKLLETVYDHADSINDISFSPNEQVFATAGRDGKVVVWSRDGNKLYDIRGHYHSVDSVQFSADGSYLVSSSRDGYTLIRNFDLKTLTSRGCGLLENYLRSPSSAEQQACK